MIGGRLERYYIISQCAANVVNVLLDIDFLNVDITNVSYRLPGPFSI